MPPKPFGFLQHRALRELAEQAIREAANTREDRRLVELIKFDEFCAAQRDRVKATLKRHTDRIHQARYGDCEGDGSHFMVSRKGTTEVSTPLHERYQHQR